MFKRIEYDEKELGAQACKTCKDTCCAFILRDVEWQEVANRMGISVEELTKKYPDRKRLLYGKEYCVFYKNKKCSIYEFRPDKCYQYICYDYHMARKGMPVR